MADKEFRFSRDNIPACEGEPSTSEDPHQLIERLLLTEPAGDGDPRLTEEGARWGEHWVEEYLEYHGEEMVWAPAAGMRTHRGEPWVEAYLAYYGEETVWPQAIERRTRRSELWVQEYLAYDGQETDWPSPTEPPARHGERWVQEYLDYYGQETARRTRPAAPGPVLKAASHG